MHLLNAHMSYMEKNKFIQVEVAYAKPDKQMVVSLEMPTFSTIEAIILQSNILKFFPEIDLTRQSIGIFGKISQLSDYAREGDRIEIYRSLLIDPKEARRKRAKRP